MSTILGSVTLDTDMYFTDEYKHKLINADVAETIGGGIIIQEFQAVEAGRFITLESTISQGLQTKAVVDALKALSDVVATTYSLVISTSGSSTVTKTVRFRNEIEGGAVQFEPVIEAGGIRASTVYFRGTIYLMVV